jgi:hypothetical protein
MKRRNLTRGASILFALTLITTSVIGGTFAKYVTSDSLTSKARVAKFGVTVDVDNDLFAENYVGYSVTDGEETEASNRPAENGSLTVVSSSQTKGETKGDKVVAPGTKSSTTGTTITFAGTPEVDVKITLAIEDVKDIFLAEGDYKDYTGLSTDGYFTVSSEYHPVLFTLSDNSGAITVKDSDNKETKLENVTLQTLQDSLADYSKTVKVSESIDDVKYVLTWEWPYEQIDEKTSKSIDLVDEEDTLLGNLASNSKLEALKGVDSEGKVTYTALTKDNYSNDINVTIKATVTQVD